MVTIQIRILAKCAGHRGSHTGYVRVQRKCSEVKLPANSVFQFHDKLEKLQRISSRFIPRAYRAPRTKHPFPSLLDCRVRITEFIWCLSCGRDETGSGESFIVGTQGDDIDFAALKSGDVRNFMYSLGVKRSRNSPADGFPDCTWECNSGVGFKNDKDHQFAHNRDDGDRVGHVWNPANRNLELRGFEASSIDLDLPVFTTDNVHDVSIIEHDEIARSVYPTLRVGGINARWN